MPICVSTPIPYDSLQLIGGVGGQYIEGKYTDICGAPRNYKTTYVRGDVQFKYGIKKVVEMGAQGGMAAGNVYENDTLNRTDLIISRCSLGIYV